MRIPTLEPILYNFWEQLTLSCKLDPFHNGKLAIVVKQSSLQKGENLCIYTQISFQDFAPGVDPIRHFYRIDTSITKSIKTHNSKVDEVKLYPRQT